MQLEFSLKKHLTNIPAPSLPLVALLHSHPEGMSATHIAQSLGMQPGESARRRVRSLASAARPWVVSGPGGKGYLHLVHATSEDLLEAARRHEHQASENKATASLYIQAYHARGFKRLGK